MIKIYGSPRSSAGRCYLMLEECGLKYEHVKLDMGKKEHKSVDYLKINPNGKVPALTDGELQIWESIAINNYLAEKYMPELLGHGPEAKGLVYQWSVWAMTEMQSPFVDILIQLHFVPEEKRNHDKIEKAKMHIPELLNILDKALSNKKYLVNDTYSLADLNIASVLNIGSSIGIHFDQFQNITNWFSQIKNRPAWQKFVEARN